MATPTLSLPNFTSAQQTASQLMLQSPGAFSFLSNFANRSWNEIWNNPDQIGASPPLVWAAFGTNAQQWRAFFLGLSAYLNQVVPNSVPAEPIGTGQGQYTIVNNADGSVMVTAAVVAAPTNL